MGSPSGVPAGNRFYSCSLDGDHFWRAMCYVERNPVRAKIVRVAWRYAWSSAAAHCGKGPDETGLLNMGKWSEMSRWRNWPACLQSPQDEKELAGIRLCTHRGRPLGGDSFMSKMEALLGRRLRPLPVGRPRKNANRTEASPSDAKKERLKPKARECDINR